MLKKLSLQPVCLNYYVRSYQAWIPEEMEQFIDDWRRKIEQASEVGIPVMTMGFGHAGPYNDLPGVTVNIKMARRRSRFGVGSKRQQVSSRIHGWLLGQAA